MFPLELVDLTLKKEQWLRFFRVSPKWSGTYRGFTMQRHAAFHWFIFIIVFSCAGGDIFHWARLDSGPWLKLIKSCRHRQLWPFWNKISYSSLPNPAAESFIFSLSSVPREFGSGQLMQNPVGSAEISHCMTATANWWPTDPILDCSSQRSVYLTICFEFWQWFPPNIYIFMLFTNSWGNFPGFSRK